MTKLERRGKRVRVLLSAVSAALGATASASYATITLNTNGNSTTNWTISNGDLNVTFDPAAEDLTSIAIGASGNLLDSGSNSKLYPEFAGTPFGSGTQTFGSVQGANFLDVWTSVASTGTSTNPLTYAFHYVFFNNDPNIATYQVVTHSATDPATSVGQGQFLARVSPSKFFDTYQTNVSPNNIGVQNGVVPAYTDSTGRDVQDATVDVSGEAGINGDWGTHFYTKYDYSSYTQFLQANTEYGPTYSVSTIFTGMDTMNGGPTKQNLQYTNNIAMVEFLSDHYATGDANYSYTPQQGIATSRLFGPYDFSFNLVSGQTGAQLNAAAVASIPTLQTDYNADTELTSLGYVPMTTAARGTVAVNATSTAGWSSTINNNTAVLSDPNRSMQESSTGYQYWGQLSSSGATTISNVVPGTYRMTLYQLGQWGETRIDGVHVSANTTTTPANAAFIPENFSTGTNTPIWTIGTPDRSSHEFLNSTATAANTGVVTGGDLRQFYGSYDYWAEEQTLGHPGQVVYYATAVGSTPATNNPQAWIANQWGKFDPGIYDPANSTTDGYSLIAPAYVTAGGGPGTYGGSAWDVNFTTTTSQSAQGSLVTLTVGLAANEASLVVSLNGHTETWHFGGTASDPMVRSGVAGVYQMLVYQWPVADLNAAGTQDQFTFGVSQTDGVMYDAMRLEITNTSAAPNITGWHDYAFINSNGSSNAANPDTILPTDPPTWNLTTGGSWATSTNWEGFNGAAGVVPDAVSATAYLTGSPGLTSAGSITLDGSETLGLLDFNNSTSSYTISQGTGGSLILDNGSGQAQIVDESGNHTISAPVVLNSTTVVSTSSSSNAITISGVISGAGNLLFSGTGTLLLSAANTYTGTTSVNSGILIFSASNTGLPGNLFISAGATAQVGTGGTAGTMPAGNVTDNGTLLFDRSDNPLTISTVIPGLGAVTQAGTGTLVLTGINTYSGGTNINAGAIRLNSASSIGTGGVAVASTAKLDLNGFSISIPSLTGLGTVDDITAGGNPTLTVSPTATSPATAVTFAGSIKNTTGTLGLTKTGTGTLFLSGVNTYTGATNVSIGTLEIGSPGSIAGVNVNVSSGAVLTVDSGAAIGATTALSDAGTTNFNNATQTIATLNGAGTLNLNPSILTVSGGGTFSGLIAGTGGITVSGGALILSHADTYTGSTSVTGGSLEIASPGSLADTTISTSSGATLTVDSGASLASATTLTDNGIINLKNTAQTISTLTGTGTLNLTPIALTYTGTGQFFNGKIIGTGSLTVSSGSLLLGGVNTYSGSTSVTGGCLEISFGGSIASTAVSVSSGATLYLDAGPAISASTTLSDAGTFTLYSGTQTIATLNGAGSMTLHAGTLTVSGGGTFSGPITGAGGLTVSGGSLVLSGADTFSGATSVTGGHLEIASPGSLGSVGSTTINTSSGATFTVDSGATLAASTIFSDAGTVILQESSQNIASLNGAGTLNLNPTALTVTGGGTFSGPITGSGSLTTSGGTLVLSNTESFTGATTVTGGRFELAFPGSLASTNVSTTFAGATLTVDSGTSLSASTTLSDAGTVTLNNSVQTIATLNGAGNLNLNPTLLTVTGGGTFSGSVAGTGSLTASASTLTLSGSVTIPTIKDLASATLNLNGTLSSSPSITVSGQTTFGPSGSITGPSLVTVGSLSLGSAGNATLSSAPLQGNRTVLLVNGPLSFGNTPMAPQGLLDVRDNDMILRGNSASNVLSEFTSGYNGGLWNGTGGITSSVAAGTSNTALAVVVNDNGSGEAIFSSFDNQTVQDGDVLVKYTYYGDALLAGSVTANDYAAIDNGFNMGLTGWQNGDFNYNGVVNGDDYTLIDNAFNTQGSVSFAGVAAGQGGPTEMIASETEQVAQVSGSADFGELSRAVPEPGSLGLLAVGLGAGLMRRRRRR